MRSELGVLRLTGQHVRVQLGQAGPFLFHRKGEGEKMYSRCQATHTAFRMSWQAAALSGTGHAGHKAKVTHGHALVVPQLSYQPCHGI